MALAHHEVDRKVYYIAGNGTVGVLDLQAKQLRIHFLNEDYIDKSTAF